MTEEHLKAILEVSQVEKDDQSWLVLPEGRHLTLHAARDGVNLSVGRIEALKHEGDFIHARTNRGEVYVLVMEDLFAGAVDGTATKTRKAGFLG